MHITQRPLLDNEDVFQKIFKAYHQIKYSTKIVTIDLLSYQKQFSPL